MTIRVLAVAVAVLLCGSGLTYAQGEQTGILTGRVTTAADGEALPGTTVTVSSAALQGLRSTTSDVNGVYLLRALPPGEYSVTIELTGIGKAERLVRVPLAGTTTLDEALSISIHQQVEVTGSTSNPLTRQPSRQMLEPNTRLLPVGRTPFLLLDTSTGLTDNTPNASQVSISGGFAYDNVFLVNGVDVNDNLFGRANDLFIEEAIDEVQVRGSSISAEYGRFSGGVVNVITRSGSNRYSGGVRLNLSNPAWSDETPFERTERISRLAKTLELVGGGPLVKDRLWFFTADRRERNQTQGAFPVTGAPLVTRTANTRYEIKLTGSPRPGQTLRGSFIDNDTNTAQASLPFAIDPRTYVTPHTPNRLAVTTYEGMMGSRALVTGQYSQKRWGVRNNGNTSTNILDSPFLTRTGAQLAYNAPHFDSTDPEDRNNQQVTGSVAYFASSRGLGSHDLKGGGERFVSTRVGGNSQTSTGYRFLADFATSADGRPMMDANNRLIPMFVPGTTRVQAWFPTRGAQIDIATTSFFLQDRVTAGSHWSFDLGVRYEHVGSEATAVNGGISANTVVPRLAANFDPRGDGRTVLRTSYGLYAGKYSDIQFARNTNVGNADSYTLTYNGPAGEGLGFAEGFNLVNYNRLVSGTFARDNVRFADDLRSPITKELVFGLDRQLSDRADAHVSYVRRSLTNVVEDFITLDGGTTVISRNGLIFGTFNNVVWRNTEVPQRDYQALEVQSSWRIAPFARIWSDWTVQLRNHGNFEGEGANNPAIGSLFGDYPEMLVANRNFPTGRLDDFQRHRVRLWGTYSVGRGRLGTLDISPMWRFNSGRTYSLVANGQPLSAIQAARNPGYLGVATQTVFFDERGSESFRGFGLLDLAFHYAVPAWRSVAPWAKLEILNTLNNQKLLSWDTTVTPDASGPQDENGLPTNYIKGPRFGQGISNDDYPRPRPGIDGGRTFLVSMGVRF